MSPAGHDPTALTVTGNVALDITYNLRGLRIGNTNRVAAVHRRAGGKGLNAARVLHALGVWTIATGVVGGATGQAVRADLSGTGVVDAIIGGSTETRSTVTVVDEETGTVTLLNEPGPALTTSETTTLVEHVAALLGKTQLHKTRVSVLVLCGSLAPGTPDVLYQQLVTVARDRGVPVVLDSSGPALARALPALPDLITPTLRELADLVGSPDLAWSDAEAAARTALGAGARSVVVTHGAEGALAVSASSTRLARPDHVTSGNPTGAGDALTAALAAGLAHGIAVTDSLPFAVSVAAAAVRSPYAGDVDPAVSALVPWEAHSIRQDPGRRTALRT